MKKIVILVAVFVFGWVLSGCATPPTEEMNRAHDAVIRAENDANAVTYAPNTLIRARDALARMQSEADAKRYDAARDFAAEAISNAERAIAEGRTGAERARTEAANLINSVQGLLAETTDSLNTARERREVPLDFNALSGELDVARQTFNNAQQNFQNDNYHGAITDGQTARSLLGNINAQLNDAVQIIARK